MRKNIICVACAILMQSVAFSQQVPNKPVEDTLRKTLLEKEVVLRKEQRSKRDLLLLYRKDLLNGIILPTLTDTEKEIIRYKAYASDLIPVFEEKFNEWKANWIQYISTIDTSSDSIADARVGEELRRQSASVLASLSSLKKPETRSATGDSIMVDRLYTGHRRLTIAQEFPGYRELVQLGDAIIPLVIEKMQQPENAFAIILYEELNGDPTLRIGYYVPYREIELRAAQTVKLWCKGAQEWYIPVRKGYLKSLAPQRPSGY